jgi:hypothetical protein
VTRLDTAKGRFCFRPFPATGPIGATTFPGYRTPNIYLPRGGASAGGPGGAQAYRGALSASALRPLEKLAATQCVTARNAQVTQSRYSRRDLQRSWRAVHAGGLWVHGEPFRALVPTVFSSSARADSAAHIAASRFCHSGSVTVKSTMSPSCRVESQPVAEHVASKALASALAGARR